MSRNLVLYEITARFIRYYAMQLVTPSAVAMADRIEIAV